MTKVTSGSKLISSMHTKITSLRLARIFVFAILVIITITPTLAYATMLWLVWKTFWGKYLTLFPGGLIWLVAQSIFGLWLGVWWDESFLSPKRRALGAPPTSGNTAP